MTSTKQQPLIILASQSKNRRQLLESLKVVFCVEPSNVDEETIVADNLEERVRLIAFAKAKNIAKRISALIIAADSFSVYDGKEYQKPRTREEAIQMLRELSGKQGRVLTGVCIIDTRFGREVNEVNTVMLQCKPLSEEEIVHYVSTRPVTEWAATYNPLDDMSVAIFKPVGTYPYRIEYYGIGIETLVREFQRAGVSFDLSAALPIRK